MLFDENGEGPVGEVSITGDVGSFEINPIFNVIDAEIVAEVTKGLFDSSFLGIEVYNSISLLDNQFAFGVGTIAAIDYGDVYDIVTISVSQVEVSGVPTPSTMVLFLSGVVALVYLQWRKLRPLRTAGISGTIRLAYHGV